jgi:hypothetical protein
MKIEITKKPFPSIDVTDEEGFTQSFAATEGLLDQFLKLDISAEDKQKYLHEFHDTLVSQKRMNAAAIVKPYLKVNPCFV